MLEVSNTKPKTVQKAVQILYVMLALGIIRSIMEFPRLAAEQSDALGGVEILIFIQAFSLGAVWLLIFFIGKRKNWARYLYLIFFILGCPLSIMPLIKSLDNDPISGLLGLIQIAAQVLALILLFKAPSREWFKKPSEVIEQRQG